MVRRRRTHGHSRARKGNPTPTYKAWQGMWERCTKPQHKSYPRYGGRGITIAPEWSSFERFLSDMGERPPGLSLDRIDNDGPYSKDNCRWATRLEQVRSRSSTKLTPESAAFIRLLLARGFTGRDVALLFRISPQLVSDIRHGRRWAHAH